MNVLLYIHVHYSRINLDYSMQYHYSQFSVVLTLDNAHLETKINIIYKYELCYME